MARANLNHGRGLIPENYKESDLIDIEVASGYNTADIYPGDPVNAQTDGTVIRTPAGSAAGVATDGITGVVVEILQFKDSSGNVRRNGKYLPSGTTWTAHRERSRLLVLPVTNNQMFRCIFDTAIATMAAARSLRFGNADHVYGGAADQGLGLTSFQIDISTLATTNTLQWRVVNGTINKVSNDPLQATFEGLVVANLIKGWPVLGESTTGVT